MRTVEMRAHHGDLKKNVSRFLCAVRDSVRMEFVKPGNPDDDGDDDDGISALGNSPAVQNTVG